MFSGLFKDFMDKDMKHQNSVWQQLVVAKWLCLGVTTQEDPGLNPNVG